MNARALVVVPLLFALACGPAGPRAAARSRPVDERRAGEVIARTFKTMHVDADTNRDTTVLGGKPVHLEVAASGHKYGVAFLTREQEDALADVLPKRRPDSDALIILPGDEDGVRVLVLFERDYLHDDLAGDEHTSTHLAAEMKIDRDVKDFLRKATEDQWP